MNSIIMYKNIWSWFVQICIQSGSKHCNLWLGLSSLFNYKPAHPFPSHLFHLIMPWIYWRKCIIKGLMDGTDLKKYVFKK